PFKIKAGQIDTGTFSILHKNRREYRARRRIEDQARNRREMKTRTLRLNRMYAKLATAERRYVQKHTETKTSPIMCIGSWTGANSTIKGHRSRGGSHLRRQHRQYCPVAITPEHNTSKICLYCFQKTTLHKAVRTIRERRRMVRLNGAVECRNPTCPS